MSDGAVAITGLGLISALGHDVVTSCAAARAGLSRASALSFQVYSEEEWADVALVGHRVAGYADGFEGFGKLVRLCTGALRDLIQYAGVAGSDFSRTAVYINLPSDYYAQAHARMNTDEEAGEAEQPGPAEALRLACQAELIGLVTSLNGLEIPATHQIVNFGGRSGWVSLVYDAAQRLHDGTFDRCIVGAVDSCVDAGFISAAYPLGVLKDEASPHGLIPGEAAAFILLELLTQAVQRGARVEALVEAPAFAAEEVHRLSGQPSTGVALAQTIEYTLRMLPDQGDSTGLVIADLNGDPFRAGEGGHAVVRLLPEHTVVAHAPQWYPADFFGDVGAATGAVAVCLAVRGFARNYAGTSHVLVWLSSEDGSKGAFYIREYRSDAPWAAA